MRRARKRTKSKCAIARGRPRSTHADGPVPQQRRPAIHAPRVSPDSIAALSAPAARDHPGHARRAGPSGRWRGSGHTNLATSTPLVPPCEKPVDHRGLADPPRPQQDIPATRAPLVDVPRQLGQHRWRSSKPHRISPHLSQRLACATTRLGGRTNIGKIPDALSHRRRTLPTTRLGRAARNSNAVGSDPASL